MSKKWLAAFILLLPIFVMLSASLAYWAGYRPTGLTNQGDLVQPPLNVQQLNWRYGNKALDGYALEGTWGLVLWGCETVAQESCASAIAEVRNVQARLHRDASRVRRYLLVADDFAEGKLLDLVGEDSGIRIFTGEDAQLREQLAAHLASPLPPEGVYCAILDPHGNLMMIHRREQFGEALYEDLRKLLRLSQIG